MAAPRAWPQPPLQCYGPPAAPRGTLVGGQSAPSGGPRAARGLSATRLPARPHHNPTSRQAPSQAATRPFYLPPWPLSSTGEESKSRGIEESEPTTSPGRSRPPTPDPRSPTPDPRPPIPGPRPPTPDPRSPIPDPRSPAVLPCLSAPGYAILIRLFRPRPAEAGDLLVWPCQRCERFPREVPVKRTYQPNRRRRLKRHGFRTRMQSADGRNILRRRRAKGRLRLAAKASN
jgi:large subunit ribosomal protein L34